MTGQTIQEAAELLYVGLFQREHGLPDKPLWGQPCNGCGLCCLLEQCPLSEMLFGDQIVCPALDFHGGSSHCRVVSNPGDYAPAEIAEDFGQFTLRLLGAGRGCDSCHSETDRQLRDRDRANPPKSLRADGRWAGALIKRMMARMGFSTGAELAAACQAVTDGR